MWILDAPTAQQAPSLFTDLYHSFLIFLAMFFSQKFHQATGGDK